MTARMDKAKLDKAIERERAKRDPKLAAEIEERRRREEDNKPEWLKEAEAINQKGKRRGDRDQDDVDVTEEQLEAYRRVNTHAYEDPMANYRDEEA